MGDRMRPISFAALMERIEAEYEKTGRIFGVSQLYKADPARRLPLFGGAAETPIGPAAGPHTQLSQNIAAAYAAGARYFELKTVQTLDGEDLTVAKPCILAADEGYNCEWSTELTVEDAMAEYIRAWWALSVMSRRYGLGAPDGFVFNMSVGYTFDGIRSEKIDRFIEGLKNAAGTAAWAECAAWAAERGEAAPSPNICSSITLSTLHGCPPAEIERIASYLIREKKLHTLVKCNPTLLGYDFARSTLDRLGYDYLVFDDLHFKGDLQYADAVPMFRRLQALAAENGVSFGLKLTNTFPVTVAAGELPSEEMYMSGRALYPLTAALAAKLSREFEGKLRISFSGGADANSVRALAEAGIWPITMATTLLKPGGYGRLAPLAKRLEGVACRADGAVDPEKTAALAASALTDGWYRKPAKPAPARKNGKPLPLLDCFFAPCTEGCPLGQDIPAYLRLLGQGKTAEAAAVIALRNALPHITSVICPHRCEDRCTRCFYEGAVDIRGCKAESLAGFDEFLKTLQPAVPTGQRAAVVGAGPAGLAAAYFLARAGVAVTVYEKEQKAGGLVRYAIPDFRISEQSIEQDLRLCEKLGVAFRFGCEVQDPAALLAEGYDAVLLAVGAPKAGALALEKGASLNAVDFLKAYKKDPAALQLGRYVAVAGAGNTAMDAARAAKRVPGVEEVSVVYRRTRRYMPADAEEFAAAEAEGVRFLELLSPVSLENGQLLCRVTALGAPDEKGRRAPVDTGETRLVSADTVIAALGERVDGGFYEACGIALDEKGRPALDADMRAAEGVYIIGDGSRGPATVAEAIADAQKAAAAVCGARFDRYAPLLAAGDKVQALARRGDLAASGEVRPAPQRCLECATVCECCVEVCPNRANVPVQVGGKTQILHLDGMCNECGNCETFCPYSAAPYRDKLTVFWSRADFDDSENQGFLLLGGGRFLWRLFGRVFEADGACEALPEQFAAVADAVKNDYPWLLGR